MIVLGIESSCDETAAAVVDGGGVRSDVVSSQVDLHARWGGVVPEIASRAHLDRIGPVVRQALREAGIGLGSVEGVAVTCAPGLVGSLLVGVSYAKSLAFVRGLPLVGVHHLEGHLLAPFLSGGAPEFPFVALVVSGGHTALYRADGFGEYRTLGETRDDAAGEAFDKAAKLLGLPYPGGVVIDRLARGGDPAAVRFPRGMVGKGGLDFSFSGLKTALLQHVRTHGIPEGQGLADLCASYQEAIVDVLARKTLKAAERAGVGRIVLSGGVAANSRLRERMGRDGERHGLSVRLPEGRHCTDNAAMIAYAGRQRLVGGERHGLDLGVASTSSLERSIAPPPVA
ncbi:tRNA (adenosine(37)-N6)-threonylcarbamoyltransferase complex transferase subunit TsaD [Myxococcota bacterium]|nr:tRNA (adenosine(37)-N6)-threonylcarbamoyltransferase complex transferase subunit TsaD [Myxococcota bacterium]